MGGTVLFSQETVVAHLLTPSCVSTLHNAKIPLPKNVLSLDNWQDFLFSDFV